MSSLLVLQDKNNVIMTSDTASSVEIDGISYRVSGNEKKIFDLNGYKVFASGQKHIRDLFISLFSNDESTFNPISAEKLLKKMFLGFDEYSLEIVIAEKSMNSTMLYFLSSYEQFNVKKSISEDVNILMFTAGIKTKEISDSFEDEFSRNGNVIESLQLAYSKNQNEQVGGSLEIHQLITDVVKEIQLPIIDVNTIQDFENVHLIIGERIVGKLLMGNRLIIEDEEGIIRLSGSLQEIFDPEGNVKVAIGKYATGKYGMRIDSGSLEIIGGLTENQLNQSIKDKLQEANGVRSDLRLTAPLPTNLTLNGEGITATVTGSPSKFARMDYRGLYIQGGALDIRTSATTNSGVVFDGLGISAYNSGGSRTFYVDTNGNLAATSATISGHINATSGTFSGSLNAATGSFSGSLNAATGSFSGHLNAASGSFSGALNGATGTFGGLYTGTINADQFRGSSFTVGYGTGSTMTLTSTYGAHVLSSNDSAGMAIQSNNSLSLRANGNYGVYVPYSPLVAGSGFRVEGGLSQFNTDVTVNATLKATTLYSGGSLVATQQWVGSQLYSYATTTYVNNQVNSRVTTTEMNNAINTKANSIYDWVRLNFVPKT